MRSELVDLWDREIRAYTDCMLRSMVAIMSPTEAACYYVEVARSLTYEARSRLHGRIRYWVRRRNAGRVSLPFDLEAIIRSEIAEEHARIDRKHARLIWLPGDAG